MSRAFVKDDDWEDPVVAPRPPLPPGAPNYVTPRGRVLLQEEMAALDTERARLEADTTLDDGVRRRRASALAQRMRELTSRIATAQVVDPRATAAAGGADTVRFGATVTLRARSGPDAGEVERLQIVGVDEADPEQGRIAFTVPMAQVVLGKRIGDTVLLRAAGGERSLEITAVDYATGEDAR
jgi:transcription elongation factor GreB